MGEIDPVDWTFLQHICGGDQGKILLAILGVAAAAFALGGAIFNYLRDRLIDRWGKEIRLKKKQLGELEEVLNSRETLTQGKENAINLLRNAILGSDDEFWRLHEVRQPPLLP
jgi:hypothetical protein